jgi:cytochrome c oxidase subunit 2
MELSRQLSGKLLTLVGRKVYFMKRTQCVLCLVAIIIFGTLVASCESRTAMLSKQEAAEPAPATTAPVPATDVKDTGVVVKVDLDAKSWKFTPEEIHAKWGDTLDITLHSTVGLHSAKMDDGYKFNLKDGKQKTIQLNVKGKFQYYCAIQCGHGHDEMVGYLIVE